MAYRAILEIYRSSSYFTAYHNELGFWGLLPLSLEYSIILNTLSMNLIVSKLTTYDHDDQLYYTKIGQNNPEMTLFCIVAGKSPKESRERAEKLISCLHNNKV